jgi:hypothetical protein
MKVWLLCLPLGNRIDEMRWVRGWIDKCIDNDDIVGTISLKLVEILMDSSNTNCGSAKLRICIGWDRGKPLFSSIAQEYST